MLAAIAAQPRTAYATLLYDDSFLLGVRVLGKALEENGSNRFVPCRKDFLVMIKWRSRGSRSGHSVPQEQAFVVRARFCRY